MRLSLKATAIACGLLWGGAILLVGLINLASSSYGLDFLQMIGSVYPWFHPSHTLGSVFVGTLEGFFDGAIGGLFFAALYNGLIGGSRATNPASWGPGARSAEAGATPGRSVI